MEKKVKIEQNQPRSHDACYELCISIQRVLSRISLVLFGIAGHQSCITSIWRKGNIIILVRARLARFIIVSQTDFS